MGGWGYDYNLGRFISMDPFIQDPGNSQSINAFAYIMNNPLSEHSRMTRLLIFFVTFVSRTCRSRASLQLEVAAFRHQIAI